MNDLKQKTQETIEKEHYVNTILTFNLSHITEPELCMLFFYQKNNDFLKVFISNLFTFPQFQTKTTIQALNLEPF